jgi:hypothetical protein
MIRVYCDTGAFRSELVQLEQAGRIAVHQFKYENQNRRIRLSAIPSDLRYDDLAHYTYGELGTTEFQKDLTYDDLGLQSEKLNEILRIVGRQNRQDARHLDSAFMTACRAFLTSDKGDIWSKRCELKAFLGFSIFYVGTEWDDFLCFVENGA